MQKQRKLLKDTLKPKFDWLKKYALEMIPPTQKLRIVVQARKYNDGLWDVNWASKKSRILEVLGVFPADLPTALAN